tara:strand:+ start:1579 stop:1704 length:126 start_codon:yes stop_codon:yes gene_type:complete
MATSVSQAFSKQPKSSNPPEGQAGHERGRESRHGRKTRTPA